MPRSLRLSTTGLAKRRWHANIRSHPRACIRSLRRMDDDEEAILICYRVAEVPIPYRPGTIRICTQGCLERVWVADSSPTHARPVCWECAATLFEDSDEVKLMLT